MFDLDNWTEIFSTIKKNKLRTFLTGFSVSWGILMFCILLSAGNGLRNGMVSSFGSRSVNSVQYWGRRTSIPFEGLHDNRRIVLDDKDLDYVKKRVPESVELSPMIETYLDISYEGKSSNGEFVGIEPNYATINGVTIKDKQGRFLNVMDVKEKRKVVVINERLREILFGQDGVAVGKMIMAGKVSFMVIGVFQEQSWGNQEKAYIPLSTAQLLYNGGHGYHDISFTVKGLETEQANEDFENRFRQGHAAVHHYDPSDKRAIGIWNQLQNYLQFIGIFNGISAFIWIIGVGTLIAGVIGISNIMLITVRERTREIGIRKALGAKPSSILISILTESVFISAVFGYIGMFMGVGFGQLISSVLEQPGMEQISNVIKDPTIDVRVAVAAMLVLILSGLIAGYFPALKAVKISPVEAMRAE